MCGGGGGGGAGGKFVTSCLLSYTSIPFWKGTYSKYSKGGNTILTE